MYFNNICTFILLNRRYSKLFEAINLLMLPRKELHCLVYNTMYKKCSFPLKISSVNVKKSLTEKTRHVYHTISGKQSKSCKQFKKIQKYITLLTV